jgi:hypothetical protein
MGTGGITITIKILGGSNEKNYYFRNNIIHDIYNELV